MGERVPKRIQMRRTRGWRKPEGAVYVGRPSKWGNPFRVGVAHCLHDDVFVTPRTPEQAVKLYRDWVTPHRCVVEEHLRGKDLACWCPLDQPCHADVLLELANRNDNPKEGEG